MVAVLGVNKKDKRLTLKHKNDHYYSFGLIESDITK